MLLLNGCIIVLDPFTLLITDGISIIMLLNDVNGYTDPWGIVAAKEAIR